MMDVAVQISDYLSKDKKDQASMMRHWRSLSWDDSQSTQFILGLCTSNLWNELGHVWTNKSLRSNLYRLVDEIQRLADKQNAVNELAHALPGFYKREFDAALAYPIKTNNVNLLDLMLSKGAKPSNELIRVIANRYDGDSNEFYRNALYKTINSKNWRGIFGFNALHDWTNIVRRAYRNGDYHLLVVASRVMTNHEKLKLLKDTSDEQQIDLLIRHMRFSKYVLTKADQTIKKRYLMENLEI